jgi:hypothetical protein
LYSKDQEGWVVMKRSFLSILMIALFFGMSIALGQESSPDRPRFYQTIGYIETDQADAITDGLGTSVSPKELTSEELDQIFGEGLGGFLTANENQTGSPPWVILWDEILNQRNASMEGSIELTSGNSFMNSIQVNNILSK